MIKRAYIALMAILMAIIGFASAVEAFPLSGPEASLTPPQGYTLPVESISNDTQEEASVGEFTLYCGTESGFSPTVCWISYSGTTPPAVYVSLDGSNAANQEWESEDSQEYVYKLGLYSKLVNVQIIANPATGTPVPMNIPEGYLGTCFGRMFDIHGIAMVDGYERLLNTSQCHVKNPPDWET